jgi:hypothetical protein
MQLNFVFQLPAVKCFKLPAPCSQIVRLPATWSQIFKLPATCSQIMRLPAPCSQIVRLPATWSQIFKLPATCSQIMRLPAPCSQIERLPAICSQKPPAVSFLKGLIISAKFISFCPCTKMFSLSASCSHFLRGLLMSVFCQNFAISDSPVFPH